MNEHADPKFLQGDWSGDPANPVVAHQQIEAQFGLRCSTSPVQVPSDIRRLIHEETRETNKLNTWFRAMGISRIDQELFMIDLAYKAVRRANNAA